MICCFDCGPEPELYYGTLYVNCYNSDADIYFVVNNYSALAGIFGFFFSCVLCLLFSSVVLYLVYFPGCHDLLCVLSIK